MSLYRRISNLFSRSKVDREIDVELQAHIELRMEDNVAAGMSPEVARRDALLRFGNPTVVKEHTTAADAALRLESLRLDIRHAFRQLCKSPAFTLTAVLTFALGIAATTTIFSLVYASLMRGLPYPEADRIVHIQDVRLQGQSTAGLVGAPRFFDIRSRSRSFDSLTYFYFDHPTLIAGMQLPLAVKAVGVDGQFWKVFGVQPLLGRAFDESHTRPNMPDEAVLSYGAWQQIFAGDPKVIGKQVSLDHEQSTIVGVMPQGFQMPSGIDLWRTGHFDPSVFADNRNEGTRFFNVSGRLKRNVSLQAAQDDLTTISARLQREYPATDGVWQFASESLRDDLYGSMRPGLIVLQMASGFLLLIACINIANLLLSRATVREREVALRRALGASEARIRLQFLIEGTLLSLLGGTAGLAAAFVVVHALAARLPGRLGAPGAIGMNWPVICFALALSFSTGIAFGLVPAWRNRRVELNTAMKRGDARLDGSSGSRLRSAFISVQVGLSLMLLIGACLLGESLWNLMKSPLGFEPDHLLTFSINLPWGAKPAAVSSFYADLQQRISALPGVTAAGQIDALPTVDWHLRSNFDADWLPRTPGRPAINAEDRHVSGDYLKAIGIPLLAGRAFADHDVDAKPNRVIINQQLAQQYLPGGNPIGRHLIIGRDPLEIVGVIGNVRGTAGSIARAVGPEVYWLADGDEGVTQRSFVVRSHLPPEQLIKSIREQVHKLDPQQAIGNVSTMDGLLDKTVAQPRLNMVLVASFAAIALMLACVGIYGIVAYSVSQRTREIGVRMALGATRAQVSLLFVGRTLIPAGIGLIAGTCGALLLTRLLRSALYGVEPNSFTVYAISAVLLLFPVLMAALRPALTAGSVNPVEALRAE